MRHQKENKGGYKKYLKAAIAIAVLYSAWIFFFNKENASVFSGSNVKKISLELDGLIFEEQLTDAKTVGEFLEKKGIDIGDDDQVYPEKEAKIYFGSRIYANKARKILVSEGGESKEIYTLALRVGEAVREKSELKVGEYDLIKPDESSYVQENLKVSITHVKVEKETKKEAVAFKTVSNENDELGWREKKITTKGEKGEKEVIYEVVYHDGKEIKRKKTEEMVIKEPVDEVVTQGTYVKLGSKVHTGFGSWYGQPKYLETKYPSASGYWAANPWLPMGSYAKVTNKENGKSVIVRINDRGPFGPNRIIDLGKPAFAAIASLGAGIIDVKMEEVKN